MSYTNGGSVVDTTYVRIEYAAACATVYSDTAMVIVHPAPVSGTITGGSICPGDNIALTIAGYTGDSIYWESSPAGMNTWSVMAGETADNINVSPSVVQKSGCVRQVVYCPQEAPVQKGWLVQIEFPLQRKR